MDINYETNSSFPIFSLVEHPLSPVPPQSMLKSPRTFLDPLTTLNKGERGIFNSQILGFGFVSNNFVHDCSSVFEMPEISNFAIGDPMAPCVRLA